MNEQAYQMKITKLLESKGAYVVKVIVGNKKGIPDILASVPMTKEQVLKHFETNDTLGVFHAIEVKTPRTMNKVSPLQRLNLKKINDTGAYAIVAWSCEAVKEVIEHDN